MQFKYKHSLTANAGIYATMILLFNSVANGQQGKVNWNQFRGPNGQGVAQADRIPVHFSPEANVLWKTVIPAGHSSPVIWNHRIFLTASEPAGKKELMTLAIDRENGKTLWRQVVQAETKVRFHPLNNPASSTPAADAKHVYVYFGTYGLPVRDMDILLRIFDHDKNRIISEAEWMQTMSGFEARSQPNLLAIRPGATKDARKSHVAWEIQRGIPETPSLLYRQGRLYLLRDGGVLTCLEASTGTELFRERIGAPGQYTASPIVAGDKVVVASVRGVVTVIQVDDNLNVLARNHFGEKIFATPAVADNQIYLRTTGHLYALAVRGSPTQPQ